MSYRFDMDSFGEYLPDNWESIAARLNATFDNYIENTPEPDDPALSLEYARDVDNYLEYLWESFCDSGITDPVSLDHVTRPNADIVSFSVCVNLMDDDIREEVHAELAPCTNQAFLDRYMQLHLAKYGEPFRV